VRQSKRLFAVISAGDIPAKFLGYTLALIIVPYTGTKNLILIGACCTLASLPFFIAILGILLLNEKITWLMLLGGGIIIISTLMVTVYENKLLSFLSRPKPANV